jgi:hypothetical protein
METFLSCDLHKVPYEFCQFFPVCVDIVATHLLAQMRAASRASELNCSYSLETMCTHSGNSSTLARLRPRSKIRILGSGTPRLKRDLGYGCHRVSMASKEMLQQTEGAILWRLRGVNFFSESWTDLILAVSIASRRSSGHLECCFGETCTSCELV